ncbi:MAG: DUF1150 family protein [Alphaproteobacteria bacterium]|nr:DUF1150 family protein [Alphaproteobacteria bacterium]
MRTYKELMEMNELVAALGDISNAAYIKTVPSNKGTGYALFAADGTQLAVFPSREAAYFTARQHELEPLSVH